MKPGTNVQSRYQQIVRLSALLLFCVAVEAAEPEEIAVTGRSNLAALEAERQQVLQALYEQYNSINEDDRFDVKCKSTKVTGTLIPVVRCEPNYYSNLIGLFGRSDGREPLWNVPESVLREHNQKLQELMAKAVQENQELAELMRRHTELANSIRDRKAE